LQPPKLRPGQQALSSRTTSRTQCAILAMVREQCFSRSRRLVRRRNSAMALLVLWLLSAPIALHSREEKKKKDEYGQGFQAQISAPESEVLEAVQAVVNNGIIHGSKEYAKDPYIEGATAVSASPQFGTWNGPGQAFYKVREEALDPIGFYQSNDVGTLAVRYVVVPAKDPAKTILRIDAVFVEDFRRTSHPSDGSVELAEYKDVQGHIDAAEEMKKDTEDALKDRDAERAKLALEQKKEDREATALAVAQSSGTLEQYVQNLRRQAERVIKVPGAQLKAAPYRTAANLKTLHGGTEVVILVTTPYWFGVETEDGQHGWVNHTQLEPLP